MHTSAGGSCRSPKSTPVDDLSAPGFDSKIMGGCDRPYIGLMPLSFLVRARRGLLLCLPVLRRVELWATPVLTFGKHGQSSTLLATFIFPLGWEELLSSSPTGCCRFEASAGGE